MNTIYAIFVFIHLVCFGGEFKYGNQIDEDSHSEHFIDSEVNDGEKKGLFSSKTAKRRILVFHSYILFVESN